MTTKTIDSNYEDHMTLYTQLLGYFNPSKYVDIEWDVSKLPEAIRYSSLDFRTIASRTVRRTFVSSEHHTAFLASGYSYGVHRISVPRGETWYVWLVSGGQRVYGYDGKYYFVTWPDARADNRVASTDSAPVVANIRVWLDPDQFHR